MSQPSGHGAPAASMGTSPATEPLRRVKQAEVDWESRVATEQQASDAALKALREATEGAVRAARAEAEKDRADAVARARTSTDQEVAAIEAEGERAAQAAGGQGAERARAKKDQLIAAVLASFGSD
jgi:vacuolar-type H+-ATPase subunit H